jgi:hypothetical protein
MRSLAKSKKPLSTLSGEFHCTEKLRAPETIELLWKAIALILQNFPNGECANHSAPGGYNAQ